MASEKFSLGVLIGASISSKFTAVTASVGKSLARLTDGVKALERRQVKITAFESAGASAKLASAEFFKAKRTVEGFRTALERANRNGDPAGVKLLTRNLSEAERQMEAARRAMERKVEVVRRAKGEMTAAGASLGRYKQQLASVGVELDKLRVKQAAAARAATARSQFDQARGNFRGAAMGGAMVGGGVIAGLIQPAMEFETTMLGIAKQVEGAKDENGELTRTYYEMRDGIQAMGLEIPMATNELADLITQGARMNIQGKANLLTFARETAKMATAFELPAAELGDSMGKISQLFKMPINAIGDLGDTINYLDDNAISKGGEIIDVMQRMAGAATTVGLSAKNTAALASTFLSLGESAERAGTAGEGMLRQLNIAKMNPKRFQAGLKMIGISAEEMNKGMTVDPQGTILRTLEGIKKLKPEDQMEAVTRLFGKDWGGAIAKLANGLDEYKRQLALSNGDERKGSMDREMEQRQKTSAAHWQRMKNGIGAVAANLGNALLPSLNRAMEALIPVTAAISKWADENPQLVTSIGAVVAGLVGFKVGAAGIGLVTTAFKVLWTTMRVNPIGLLITAAMLIYSNWDGIVGGLKALWDDLTSFAKGIWEALGGSFSEVFKTIGKTIVDWSPIGLFHKAFATVLSWFGVDLPASFTTFGGQIIDGLVWGFTAGWAKLKEAASRMADAVTGIFKKKTEIQSPSRVFRGFGRMIGEGARLGILSTTAAVGVAGAQLAQAAQAGDWTAAGAVRVVAGAATHAAGGANAPSIAGPQRITFNITQSPGEDARALVDRILAELKAAQGKSRRGALGDWDGL